MRHLPSTALRRHRRGRRRGALARLVRGTLYVKAALVLVAALAIGIFYLRLSAGPLSFTGLPDRVANALAERIGPGWTVKLADSAIELDRGSLALRTVGLDIRDPDGHLVVRAPNAIVSVDTWSLVSASLQPRSIEFRDLQLRATINPDGSLSFAPAGEGGDAGPRPAPVSAQAPAGSPAAPATDAPASTVSTAVKSLFDLVLEPSGIVGALDHAKVANAKLTLVDSSGRERAVFDRVEAAFDRLDSGRRFDIRLDGPRGAWRIGGDMHVAEKGRAGTITASEVPVPDLLLLSGMSKLPGTSDLKLSGRVDAVLVHGRVARLDAALATDAGTIRIDDKDMPPIQVDEAAADASWDEARRTFLFKKLSFRGGATTVALAGELTAGSDAEPWRLSLTGHDGTLSGAGPDDAPVRLDDIALSAAGRDDGAVIERLALSGPLVKGELSGSFHTAADRGGMRLDVRAHDLAVRAALRLWPNSVAPNVRNYLVDSLRGGTAETLSVAVALGHDELVKANSGGPVPDDALKVDFAIRDGELAYAEGLPPLSRTRVEGTVTGTRATVRAPQGQAVMADGRSLALSDGTFVVPDFWTDDTAARIAFRLGGGADALVSFLQTPLMRTIAGLDIDPAAVTGRADLAVTLPMPLKDVPKFADLPISVGGTVTDLSIDKVFGKDKLEGADLTVSYDGGDLGIRGGGKLAGSPVAIDVHQPHGGPGEAVVSLVLDEAARARKGLSFGSQLTGPVPVKAILPLAKSAKAGTRIEADLTKAAVDDFIPGWTKPAGKPGRLAFTLVDDKGPDKGTDLRDLQLDSGPVQLRGTVTLGQDGNFERADLSTFKLSPGDDMRAQVERSGDGFRVALKGNVADARPFLKKLGSSAPAPRRQGKRSGSRDGRDLDLDLAINILTGYNDEALTNATLKASLRNDELRQLQLNARIGAASVTARTGHAEGTAPLLTVQTQNAGGVLRFLDIYRRMLGGDLVLQAAMGDSGQAGRLTVSRFVLRDEPALRSIISRQTQALAEDRPTGTEIPQINVNEVEFTRARVDFTRTAGRIDFRDAAIWGMQVGFTLAGWVDFVRGRTDVSGTFVPAYGLNNVFAQVPLFGPLLGGGRNEGLFAVNFRVSGSTSAPTVSVNPLSAIAPGFLRKLFGAGGPGDIGAPPPQASER